MIASGHPPSPRLRFAPRRRYGADLLSCSCELPPVGLADSGPTPKRGSGAPSTDGMRPCPLHRLRRRLAAVVPVIGAALAVFLFGGGDVAHAQSSQELVSNLGQGMATAGGTEYGAAQGFRTGANTDGYTLTSIDLQLSLSTTPHGDPSPRLRGGKYGGLFHRPANNNRNRLRHHHVHTDQNRHARQEHRLLGGGRWWKLYVGLERDRPRRGRHHGRCFMPCLGFRHAGVPRTGGELVRTSQLKRS